MNKPAEDITEVFDNILVNRDKSLLKEEFRRSFAPNFEFIHPLAYVPSGVGSREKAIQLYRFVRGCYWNNRLQIREIWFNEETGKMVINSIQYLKTVLTPWRWTPLKLVTILDINRNDEGKYVISRQEDLCEPENIIGVFVPYFVPTLIRTFKRVSAFSSTLIVSAFEAIGWM